MGAFFDYLWGGFDQVSEDACRNRNRGLNSDLRVDTLFHRVEDAGKRSTAVHAFYHGARQPWDPYGKDQWWHYDSVELRSVKDICSDEDLDQLEVADHGTFAKAELAVRFMPSTVSVTPPNPNLARSVGLAFTHRDGVPAAGWRIDGEPHPDGAPDLLALYAASIDESSHHAGPRQQQTYLAWFDHRLARFIQALRTADPDTWSNTIFAFVADHGHRAITNPPSTPDLSSDNVLLVREELMRIRFGEAETARIRTIIDANRLSASSVYSDLLRDQVRAWAEAMNLYVYLRAGSDLGPVDTARRLLSIPMNTEPYGALVLQEDRYLFLARGEAQPVRLDSRAARAAIVPQLDAPRCPPRRSRPCRSTTAATPSPSGGCARR
ncbi:MAG: alkaline phosphatase family protein [Nocardioides sp.]